ncbi:MAG: ferritin family protein [Candidatus Omnitrophica bacterium]|nr:ferritin family protein [Candidatus Omnitrophota bacterium]
MGPVEALKLALEKEIEAKNLYESFIARYPQTKEIFTFLMNEEEKHRQLIEKKIVELEN